MHARVPCILSSYTDPLTDSNINHAERSNQDRAARRRAFVGRHPYGTRKAASSFATQLAQIAVGGHCLPAANGPGYPSPCTSLHSHSAGFCNTRISQTCVDFDDL
ncbi:hypothetical protein TWF191_000132 [Orbilia oligospora]|uniref:Uncharacterized protein n=1 Tax=Orbilia oligospora TaxID=2813651 RepID=A0A7C8V713_ORBOL|nr:hypothetical protein TWF191_000132 [Orbilia oligospora]